MKFYKQKNPATVGSYEPPKDWAKWTHFAVMDDKTGGLLASCGYFQNLEKPFEWGFDDYENAAECIEQAQLYANAPRLFALVSKLSELKMLDGTQIQKDAEELVSTINDISEPVKRLLGEDALRVINKPIGS